jgi:hypothetical protein
MKIVDVIFLSYDEPNAEENWQRLLTIAPEAIRVSGIEGIYNAHLCCAQVAATDCFYIVDGDSWILDEFRFDPYPSAADAAACFVFLARNAVTDEIHPNGGVKLVTKTAISTMRSDAVDVFSSAAAPRRLVRKVASETRFNANPFLAWRGAFRECAKQAGGAMPFQPRVVDRALLAWQTRGATRKNGTHSMQGAREGAAYGWRNRGDMARLSQVNSFRWLREQFDGRQKADVSEVTLVAGPVARHIAMGG